MDADKLSGSIKKAAQELFRRYGYHKTSVNEIAARARIAKATIYKYFESKELILDSIIMDYLEASINELAANYQKKPATPEQLGPMILKTSRVTYTVCNEFIGWDFIRESTHAQEFLKNLSDKLEYLLLRSFVHTDALKDDPEQKQKLTFLIRATKSIVFSFAFTSVSVGDVRKHFITFEKEILPYLIKGALG